MDIRGCLFDKDGTLLDFQKSWALWTGDVIEVICDGDTGLVRKVDAALGYDRAGQLIAADSVLVAGSPGDVSAVLARLFGPDRVAEIELYVAEASTDITPVAIDGLHDCLTDLSGAGCLLGVATNDSEAAARAQIDTLGLTHAFGFIAGYDSGFGAKPGPGMCLEFLRHARLAPHAAAMVGDSLHDLAAGRAAGMHCVAVLSGPASRDELAPHADAVLSDISELAGYLRGLGA